MTRTLCVGTLAFVAAAAINAVAQVADSQPHRVTVVGCVERGVSHSSGATTGTTAQAPGPDTKFVLVNVAAKPADTPAEKQAGSLADARSYRLDDANESKVAEHVGHTVEISGTVEEQTAPAVGTTGSTATADAIAPKLKVDAVRMIAPDCSRK